jgi:hypothetical protein
MKLKGVNYEYKIQLEMMKDQKEFYKSQANLWRERYEMEKNRHKATLSSLRVGESRTIARFAGKADDGNLQVTASSSSFTIE